MSTRPISLEEAIITLEDQTWRALQVSGKAMLPYLSEDCIMFFPLGMKVSTASTPSLIDVMTSEAFIPWKTYRMSHLEVTPIGKDGAVISYKVVASRAASDESEDDDEFKALISSTWRKETDGRWLLCFHQQTPY